MTDDHKDLRIQALEQRLERMTAAETRYEKQIAVLTAANDSLSMQVEQQKVVDRKQRERIAELSEAAVRLENVMQAMRRAVAEHDQFATGQYADRTKGGL